MAAHSSLKASDSHNTLKSSIVPSGFSALSLKLDAKRHTVCIPTPGLSRSPNEIRVGITLVFFLLLHGCYEGFHL